MSDPHSPHDPTAARSDRAAEVAEAAQADVALEGASAVDRAANRNHAGMSEDNRAAEGVDLVPGGDGEILAAGADLAAEGDQPLGADVGRRNERNTAGVAANIAAEIDRADRRGDLNVAKRGDNSRSWRSSERLGERGRERAAENFVAEGNHWTVVPALHRRVSYDVVNLVAPDQVARYAHSPVILCRNVFIYFSDRSIARTVALFDQSMPSPAYLCVGVSESLMRFGTSLSCEEHGGSFFYRRAS